jgi:subtilisin family serine protease
VTLGQSANGRVAQSPDPAVFESLRTLRAKAQTTDTVRVIVGVRAPFAPEGALGPAMAQVQREDIGRAQATVERRLPRRESSRAHKFDTLPFMAMEVDAAQLDALGEMEEVTHIQEDEQRALLLNTSIPFIRADQSWATGATGSGWAVAVLDDGVQNDHPFLSGRIVSEACYSTHNPSQNFYSLCPGYATASTAAGSASNCLLPNTSFFWACTHGTHVAGISSGSGATGGVAYSGVAKDSLVVSIQVFTWANSAGDVTAWDSDILKGLERVYALRTIHNIAAVNMSLGGDAYTSQASCDSLHASYKAMIDQLRSAGIATIIASGNNGYTNAISVPGCISSAVTVGATLNDSNSVASYSNSASFLDLLAPGSSILSSVPSSTYASYNGTSMATPHVAGCWSVLKSARPTATPTEIENALKATGVSVTDSKSGVATPRIDCKAAQDYMLAVTQHLLTVATAGDGVGTVTSSPGNISCGSLCSGSFAEGTSVTLTATPLAGHVFAGWSGGCNGTGSCTVSMTAARSVTATFEAAVLALNAPALSGASGSTRNYSFAVPAGASNLRIEMTAAAGSTGDADLYVRFGAAPTTSAYDCRPYLDGSNESCNYTTPVTGTYHIMVHAFSAYTNVNLSATYEYSCASATVTLTGTVTGTLNHNTCAAITTSGSVRLTGTANVQLRSGENIRFSPGFRVDSGARLSATAN